MKPKTFEELFAGTGIEPTKDENGGVHYNFNATLKKENMKTFTEKEVDKLIRATINETAEGVFEWFKNETHIIDKKTKNSIDDISEIDIKKDKKSVMDYVYPRLEKHGIIINQNK